jgi:alpha-L-fucosidase
MKRRKLIKGMVAALPAWWLSKVYGEPMPDISYVSAGEPMAKGPFSPNWDSLMKYKAPDWFRDAKFGMWAHWGAQCQPEHGDWYARLMYDEGNEHYKYHLEKYGHHSKVGFKDVIHGTRINW